MSQHLTLQEDLTLAVLSTPRVYHKRQEDLIFKNENKLPHGCLFQLCANSQFKIPFNWTEKVPASPPTCPKAILLTLSCLEHYTFIPCFEGTLRDICQITPQKLYTRVLKIFFFKKSVPKPQHFKISISDSQCIAINIIY